MQYLPPLRQADFTLITSVDRSVGNQWPQKLLLGMEVSITTVGDNLTIYAKNVNAYCP